MDEVRVIEIKKSVFADNDEDAGKLRKELKERGVYLLNLMSSPGAGKTTTLIGTLQRIKDKVRVAVMEAEIAAPDAPVLKHRLPDLEKMLWGGTLMLIVDHVINGELTWRFPFFTALGQAGGGNVMLREMLTVGVPMSLVLTTAWVVWALVRDRKTATQ